MPRIWKVMGLPGYFVHVRAETPGQALDKAIEVWSEHTCNTDIEAIQVLHVRLRILGRGAKERIYRY